MSNVGEHYYINNNLELVDGTDKTNYKNFKEDEDNRKLFDKFREILRLDYLECGYYREYIFILRGKEQITLQVGLKDDKESLSITSSLGKFIKKYSIDKEEKRIKKDL